ncbi:hypothetical protein SAMD00023353_7300340 [Rosellinia necatrix]|uniref:Uncharacterized protein n=1 Tax=Rosellinia necatrix TaxID=77044 RepID=A0A1S8AAM2_ROSNE|nr:hypothetical protein SAMD00023353_7300340 [Rosellinia necatrix]
MWTLNSLPSPKRRRIIAYTLESSTTRRGVDSTTWPDVAGRGRAWRGVAWRGADVNDRSITS